MSDRRSAAALRQGSTDGHVARRLTDGAGAATPGTGQIALSWSGFRDTTSGLATSDTYLLVVSTSRSPVSACASATTI